MMCNHHETLDFTAFTDILKIYCNSLKFIVFTLIRYKCVQNVHIRD